MGIQLNNRAVINEAVRTGLFQGNDFSAARGALLNNAPSSELSEKGDLFRDPNGVFIAMCDVDFLEDAICGQ